MSAIRISRPGIVGTTLIDLGPDTPHRVGHTFYLLGEATPSLRSKPNRTVPEKPLPRDVKDPDSGAARTTATEAHP